MLCLFVVSQRHVTVKMKIILMRLFQALGDICVCTHTAHTHTYTVHGGGSGGGDGGDTVYLDNLVLHSSVVIST